MFGGEERTHAELHDRAARLATVLADAGVRHGDRVALLLHNGFEFPESLLACHVLGACAVPVNFRLAADEIAYILEDSGAVALIVVRARPSLGVGARARGGTSVRGGDRGGRPPPGAGGCASTTRRCSATRPGPRAGRRGPCSATPISSPAR